MARRALFWVLIIAIPFTLALAACSSSPNDQSPTAQQPSVSGSDSGEEIVLTMASYIPPSYEDLHPPMQDFVDYVNEHGKGKVQIDYHHSGTLLQAGELHPGLLQGTVDLIFHTDSYIAGSLPVLGAMELPYLYDSRDGYIEDSKRGTPIFEKINEELAKENLYMLGTTAGFIEHIWTVDKPIRSPEDLKGLRIRTAGLVESKYLEELGGSSTTLSSSELYEALERGTIDGMISYVGTIPSRSLQEVLNYVNTNIFGSYGENIFIRLDKWQSLPQDVQDILIAAAEIYEDAGNEHIKMVHDKEYWPLIKEAGVEIVEGSAEDSAKFREAAESVWSWWEEQLPAGVGSEILEHVTR